MASRYFLEISSGNKICGIFVFTTSTVGGDGNAATA